MRKNPRAVQLALSSGNALARGVDWGLSTSRRSRGRARKIATIEDVIADVRKRQAQLSDYIDQQMAAGKEISVFDAVQLFGLHAQTASRLGRLLRDERALSGKAADTIAQAISQALDEIKTELGVEV